MLELNKIYCGDCLELMKQIPDKSIDLTITSPPYDNLRDYQGYSFDFGGIAKELFRITKDGGVVVWVVGDMVVDKSESGTSFKQALYFKEIGFNLHDTMIYEKDGSPFPEKTRYYQCFEYMFVLSKGSPKISNLIQDRKNMYFGKRHSQTIRKKDGTLTNLQEHDTTEMGIRFNIWRIVNGYKKSATDEIAYKHPAIFPEKLAQDHIISWSNNGDLVLDPFNGSGTTTKMAKLLGRNFIGIEISQKYCDIANQRLRQDILI